TKLTAAETTPGVRSSASRTVVPQATHVTPLTSSVDFATAVDAPPAGVFLELGALASETAAPSGPAARGALFTGVSPWVYGWRRADGVRSRRPRDSRPPPLRARAYAHTQRGRWRAGGGTSASAPSARRPPRA